MRRLPAATVWYALAVLVVGGPVAMVFLLGTPEPALPSEWADARARIGDGTYPSANVVDIVSGLGLLAWLVSLSFLVVGMSRQRRRRRRDTSEETDVSPEGLSRANGDNESDEPWYRQGPPLFDEPFSDEYTRVVLPPDEPESGDEPADWPWQPAPVGPEATGFGEPFGTLPPEPMAEDMIADAEVIAGTGHTGDAPVTGTAEAMSDAADPDADDPPMIVPVRAYYFTRAGDTLRSISAQFLNTPMRWEELRSLNTASPGVSVLGADSLLPIGTALALPGDPLPWGKPDPVYLWTLAEKFLFTAWGREPTPEEVVPFWRGLTGGAQLEAGAPPVPVEHLAPPEFAEAPEPEIPAVEEAPEPETTAEPETTTEEAPEPETTPEPDATTEQAPGAVAETTPEPEATTEQAPEPETTPEPETVAEAGTIAEAAPEPETTSEALGSEAVVEAAPTEPAPPEAAHEHRTEPAAAAEEAFAVPPAAGMPTGAGAMEPAPPEANQEHHTEPAELPGADGFAPDPPPLPEMEPTTPPADFQPAPPVTPSPYGSPVPPEHEPPPTYDSPVPPTQDPAPTYHSPLPPTQDPVAYQPPPPPYDDSPLPPAQDPAAYQPPAPTYDSPVPPAPEPPPTYHSPLPPTQDPAAYQPPPYHSPVPPTQDPAAYQPPPPPYHSPVPPTQDPTPPYDAPLPPTQDPAAYQPPPPPYDSPVPPTHEPAHAPPAPGLTDLGPTESEIPYAEAEVPRMPSYMPSLTGANPTAPVSEADVAASSSRGLAGTALGDAMMLWQLSRIRRRRGDKPDAVDPMEESLRQNARTDTLNLIEAAMRHLRAVTVGQLREKPAVLAVRVGAYGFEVLLNRPTHTPDGWQAGSGGYVLELPEGVTAEDLEATAQGPTLCPALVPVGDTVEGPLLLNIEEIGCLIVSGPGAPSVNLLNAVVGTLGSSPLAGDIRIITVGLDTPAGLPGWERVHTTSFDSPQLEELLATAQTGSGTFLDVLVVGPGNDLLIQRAGQVATTPGSRLALVGATSSVAARWPWRIHVDETTTAVVHPIACTMAAAQAVAPAMSQLLSEVADPSLLAPPRF